MWLKGLEVLKNYPELEDYIPRRGGGVGDLSYTSVAEEVDRKPDTIKRWVDLVKTIGKTEEKFLAWTGSLPGAEQPFAHWEGHS